MLYFLITGGRTKNETGFKWEDKLLKFMKPISKITEIKAGRKKEIDRHCSLKHELIGGYEV